MSDSVLLQVRPEIYGNPVYLRGLFERIRHQRSWKTVKKIFDAEIEEMEKRQPLYESAALREEIRKLTLLSDSQLANQEKAEDKLARVREERDELLYHTRHGSPDDVEWHSPQTVTGVSMSYERIDHENCRIDSRNKDIPRGIIIWSHATDAEGVENLRLDPANQERLVGEMQELRQVVDGIPLSTPNNLPIAKRVTLESIPTG